VKSPKAPRAPVKKVIASRFYAREEVDKRRRFS
jgi:hypothetical protein